MTGAGAVMRNDRRHFCKLAAAAQLTRPYLIEHPRPDRSEREPGLRRRKDP